MADIFDRLAAGLSLEERQKLFERLKGQSIISPAPLYEELDRGAAVPGTEAEYSRLPWYYRLWYFILSLFKAKAPLKIFRDRQVSVLGNRIEEHSPGLYDCQRGLLLSAFSRQMVNLKSAARFFYSALDTSVNRDRGAFFAFLGSLEMPDVHRRLEAETDPKFIAEKYPAAQEAELRQIALKAMDDALSLVTPDNRNVMYFNARSLKCLGDLSSFLFDRVIMAFGYNAAVNAEACSAGMVRELLSTLNNILTSLKNVPPLSLLESLFVFVLQERAGEPGFDLNREIHPLMTKAEESLALIREFNKRVPLNWILRCSGRDMSLSPREISGGEDWFAVYRDYWKRHIEFLFADFMKERRRRELLDSFRYFLKGTSIKILENTASDSNPDGMPVKGAFALSFLLAFHSAVFVPEIGKALRPILIEGEFLKKENRAEFTESYNSLIKLDENIKKFEQSISPSGDYGQRYIQARQDMSSLPVRRRKVQIVSDEASADALKLLEQARGASRSMVNILDGVLGRDTRGRYLSLANSANLAGKDNQFIRGIEETAEKFRKVLKLLDETELMESKR